MWGSRGWLWGLIFGLAGQKNDPECSMEFNSDTLSKKKKLQTAEKEVEQK